VVDENDLLEDRERQAQAMVDSVPVILGYADVDQRIRFANRAFQRISAVPGDVHGRHLSEVLGPVPYNTARPAIERALAGECVMFQSEIAVPEGRRFREVTYVPDFHAGKVLGFVGAGYDVTQRVLAERAVIAREAHLQRVLETMSEGLVIQSAAGRIIQANSAASRILGLSLDQLMGRTSMDPEWHAIREDGSPCPGPEHPAIRTLRTGQSIRNEILGVRIAEGPIRWLSVNSEPLYDIDGHTLEGVLATFVDVTETRGAFDRIRSLLQRLEMAQEHERRSMAMTLHEGVAQDLYAMRLMLRLLRERVGTQPAWTGVCDTLDETLDKAMVDIRQVAADLLPTGLSQTSLIDSIRRHAAFMGELSDLCVEVRETGVPRTIEPHQQVLLFRAFQEALTNVSRHAHARNASVTLGYASDAIELRVDDDGVGIDLANTQHPGSLGLLGVRERCRAAGGLFSIARRERRGTEFRVRLPLPAD
jgi:PAS domain S-box-containing protein